MTHKPNHRPQGSAAPRYVDHDERTDAEFERDMYLSLARVEEWVAQERKRQRITLVPLAIIAAFIWLFVWMVLKTSVGAGL